MTLPLTLPSPRDVRGEAMRTMTPAMPPLLSAALVHVFTASGIACAYAAMIAVIQHRWQAVFLWLGLAVIIDGLDGPLARRFEVAKRLPRFSGERLDLVIDYVTYVFIPALALVEAGYLRGWPGHALAAGILLSSLFHFSDTASKTDDHHFVGFPAIWNVVALYVFAFDAPAPVCAALVALCIVMTFVPLKWLHPVRVEVLRPLTACVAALWTIAAVWTVVRGFPAETGPKLVLALAAIYAIALSLWQGRAG
jgi:phosphatidylcholine synthase